jgi:hypothetical protein
VALAFAIAVLIAALVGASQAGVFGANPHSLRAEQLGDAERIRKSAERACASGLARECLGLYNEAQVLDPAGDSDPEVHAHRALALALLAEAGVPSDSSTATDAVAP